MHHFRWMRRTLTVAGLATVAACGSDSTGPSFPNTAGTYASVFTVTFSNSLETESASQAGTITLSSPGSNGFFTGSYVIPGGGSGVIDGTVRIADERQPGRPAAQPERKYRAAVQLHGRDGEHVDHGQHLGHAMTTPAVWRMGKARCKAVLTVQRVTGIIRHGHHPR